MATIYLYQKSGLKRGPPIEGPQAENFELVLLDKNKKEYFVPVVATAENGPFNHLNRFRLLPGEHRRGEIRVTAIGRQARIIIDNIGQYELWV